MGLITCTPYFINLPDGYFIRTLTGYTSCASVGNIVTSNNDIITYGQSKCLSYKSESNQGYFIKSSTDGTVDFGKKVGIPSEFSGGGLISGMAEDSSGNIFSILTLTITVSGNDMVLVKHNSSGVIQWQKSIGDIGNPADYGKGIIVDNNDDIIIVGNTSADGAGADDIAVVKFDTAGNLIWRRMIGGTSTEQASAGITVDSSNNVYITGKSNTQGTSGSIMIAKLVSSTGILSWQKNLDGSGTDAGLNIKIDSGGGVVVLARTAEGPGSTSILLIKLDSAGNFIWQKILGDSSYNLASGMDIDGSDNVFISGFTTNGSAYDMLIVKYDSAGDVVWQRVLGNTNLDINDNSGSNSSLTIDNNGDIVISGYTYARFTVDLLVKLPANGSLTGTYGDFTYGTSSLVESTALLAFTTGTLTEADATGLAIANTSLTSDSFPIDSLPTAVGIVSPGFNTVKKGMVRDSSDNMYMIGWKNLSGDDPDTGYDIYITKVNSSYEVQWERVIATSGFDVGYAITLDGSNNVIVSGNGGGAVIVAKYNNAGAIQWQRSITDSGGGGYSVDVATDSSNNIYLLSRISNDVLTAKYNTSGTLQWKREFQMSAYTVPTALFVSSTNDIYITGYTGVKTGIVTGTTNMFFAKYSSGGTAQFQKIIGGTLREEGHDIAEDSSGNIYVSGLTQTEGAGRYDQLIIKFNTSGTSIWQRAIGNVDNNYGHGIYIDPSNNIYCVGATILTKFNTSGTLQLQKQISASAVIVNSTKMFLLTTSGVFIFPISLTDMSSSTFNVISVSYPVDTITEPELNSTTTTSADLNIAEGPSLSGDYSFGNGANGLVSANQLLS